MTRSLIVLFGAAVLLTGCNTTSITYRGSYPYPHPRVNDRFYEPTHYVYRSPYQRPEVRIKAPVAYYSHSAAESRARREDAADVL